MKLATGHNRKLFSRPMTVLIPSLGFESSTTRMQQCGWEFSAEQDIRYQRLQIAARHKQMQSFTLCQVDLDYFRAHDDLSYLPGMHLVFGPFMSRLVVNQRVNEPMGFFNGYEPVDMMPRYEEYTTDTLDHLKIFAGMAVRNNEIIVEERDVSDLLQLILSKQEPGRQEYFKDKLKANREGMPIEGTPQVKFHAQILSVA